VLCYPQHRIGGNYCQIEEASLVVFVVFLTFKYVSRINGLSERNYIEIFIFAVGIMEKWCRYFYAVQYVFMSIFF
jgi:hypothetical protein